MNLLHDEIEDIAERIKLKILARGQQCIYARESGAITAYHVNDERNLQLSPHTLIGSYTRTARCEDIEGDLRERLAEIAG